MNGLNKLLKNMERSPNGFTRKHSAETTTNHIAEWAKLVSNGKDIQSQGTKQDSTIEESAL